MYKKEIDELIKRLRVIQSEKVKDRDFDVDWYLCGIAEKLDCIESVIRDLKGECNE